jgi:NTP pyrophosphatase (non-canonical NTP hydrolase)
MRNKTVEELSEMLRATRSYSEDQEKMYEEKLSQLKEELFNATSIPIVLYRIVGRNGFEHQVRKTAEESVELANAALHFPASEENFIEELADISIMLDQMRIRYSDRIDEVRKQKLSRLLDVLDTSDGVIP